MTIQPLGRGVLALTLAGPDLPPHDLDAPRLLALLRRRGLSLPPRTRLVALSAPGELLLLARLPRRPRRFTI